MSKKLLSLEQALETFSREQEDYIEKAEQERQEMLKRFPLEDWGNMPLEKYALGQQNSEDTFCRWMEFGTYHLGSIRGGSSRKLIIYKHKEKEGWYHDPSYKDEQEAWQAVRGSFVEAFRLAGEGEFNSIDELEPLRSGPALLLKTLHLYYPSSIIPVYSKIHIKYFLRLLGRGEETGQDGQIVRLNRALLNALREYPQLQDWSTMELMLFLYHWADPRDSVRIVKIAPGEDAQYWDDCLQGGYICVGWDGVGDLREYESKESFQERFFEVHGEQYNYHKSQLTKKSNELWTLMELEPGDLVVANHGKSKILAIGEVVEPGYEWMPEREEFRHIVHVRWDISYEQEIETQKKWAFITVGDVPFTLYNQIIRGKPGKKAVVKTDPVIKEIENAIERKGQAIFYGPPGTGKTYQARRFAVWWMLKQEGVQEPEQVLLNKDSFDRNERRLSTAQVKRKVWWVVANPKQWSWEQLFEQGRVAFHYGRLKKNYPLVQPGDLVVGCQATPDKCITALAEVSRGLHGTGKTKIELQPVARVSNGLTYDELQENEILKTSEPVRNRCQGTLFSLTSGEAEHLLTALTERNPELQEHLEYEESIGQLTRLTFHPSYSYEDFIEGFKPVDTGSGSLSLQLEDGVFKRVCREAQANPDRKYLLLIDEINRANIAKVFGEIITLLENDKRGFVITLPQSKESFTIPPNVYLLGTMNTADRSIKLLDTALRRRFAFLELMPDAGILHGAKIGGLTLDDFLVELNGRITEREGREKQIGHSYFLENGEAVTEPEELARRFNEEILPLLQEFCYEDYTTLSEYLGEKLVNTKEQSLNMEILQNPDSLLEVLEEEFIRFGGKE